LKIGHRGGGIGLTGRLFQLAQQLLAGHPWKWVTCWRPGEGRQREPKREKSY
jgi:hypothetical protein